MRRRATDERVEVSGLPLDEQRGDALVCALWCRDTGGPRRMTGSAGDVFMLVLGVACVVTALAFGVAVVVGAV